ncbi:translocation/assembly module TamB domain-containing protein [Hydrogenobaculum acidophilum]
MKKFLRGLVFLLALYFLVLNPLYFIYKHHISFGYKNRSFYVKNLAFNIDGKSIKIKKLTFYRLGIGIKGISYNSKPRFFYLKDGDLYFYKKHLYADVDELNIIFVAQNNKPSNVPDFNLRLYEKFYRLFHVNVRNLYIAGADRFSNNAFALFIPSVSLTNGVLHTKDYARYVYLSKSSRQEVYVYVPKAYLKDGYFVAKDINAVSSLFDFNVNFWWRHRIGKAIASGFIMPIKTPVFDTSTLKGLLFAYINNKNLDFTSNLNIDDIYIPKLKPIKNASFKLKGYVYPEKGVSFDGVLKSPLAEFYIDYTGKQNEFDINIKNLHLSNKDIASNLKYPIDLYAGGKLFYSVDNKILNLDLKLSNVRVYKYAFGMGLLKGNLDFKKENAGSLYYSLYGKQSVKGNIAFNKHHILTNLHLFDFYASYHKLKTNISGLLEVSLYPKFFVEGFLNASSISLPYVNIGSLPIYLSYKDNIFKVSSSSSYMDAFFVYQNNILNGYIKPKHIMLYKYIKDAIYTADISGGIINISNNNININNVGFNASSSQNLYAVGAVNGSGSFKNISGNITISNANYRFLKNIKGNVYFAYQNNTLNLKPTLQEQNFLLTSNLNISKTISFSAKLMGQNKILHVDLALNGTVDSEENISALGFVVYKGVKIPINFYIKNNNGIYTMYGKGFDIRYKNLHIKLASLNGSSQKNGNIVWTTDGFKVYLYHQPILESSVINGVLGLKPFYLKANTSSVDGLLKGSFYFGYDKKFYINSNGVMDIDDTLAFIKSKLPFLLAGHINYVLSIDDKDINLNLKSPKPVLLLSKYLSLPLYSNLDLDIKTSKDGYFTPINVVFSSSDKKHSIAFSIKASKHDIYIGSSLKSLPVYVYSKNGYYQGFLNGFVNTNYVFKNLSSFININGSINPEGLIYIKSFSMPSSYGSSSKIPKNLNMNINVKSLTPITVMLPEGNIYAGIEGSAFAKNGNFGYNLNLKAFGGELTYSNKTFYVRYGMLKLKNTKKYINVLLMSPGDSYNTYISLVGNLSDPTFNIYSNPPMPKNQLLSSFILNKSGLTALPINAMASKLSKYSPSGLASSIFGTNVNLSVYPSQSANGNLNTNMDIEKKISKNIKLKAHISTSQNPLDTYYGGSIKLTPNTSMEFQMYGNGSTQADMSYEKRFDLGSGILGGR